MRICGLCFSGKFAPDGLIMHEDDCWITQSRTAITNYEKAQQKG